MKVARDRTAGDRRRGGDQRAATAAPRNARRVKPSPADGSVRARRRIGLVRLQRVERHRDAQLVAEIDGAIRLLGEQRADGIRRRGRDARSASDRQRQRDAPMARTSPRDRDTPGSCHDAAATARSSAAPAAPPPSSARKAAAPCRACSRCRSSSRRSAQQRSTSSAPPPSSRAASTRCPAAARFFSASSAHAVGSTQLKVPAIQDQPCSWLFCRLIVDCSSAMPFACLERRGERRVPGRVLDPAGRQRSVSAKRVETRS